MRFKNKSFDILSSGLILSNQSTGSNSRKFSIYDFRPLEGTKKIFRYDFQNLQDQIRGTRYENWKNLQIHQIDLYMGSPTYVIYLQLCETNTSTIPLIQKIEYSEADKVCRIKWSANDSRGCDHISNSTIADLVQSESLNLQGIDSNSAWNECSCKMSSEYKMFTWLMFTFGFLIPTIAFIISYIRFASFHSLPVQ